MERREIALDVASLQQVCASTDIPECSYTRSCYSYQRFARHSSIPNMSPLSKNLSAESACAVAVTVLNSFTRPLVAGDHLTTPEVPLSILP